MRLDSVLLRLALLLVALGVLLVAQGLAVAALHPWTGVVTTLGPPLAVALAAGLAIGRERTPS